MVVAAEDLEAGTRKPKFQTEPTLPIYLKVTNFAMLQVSYLVYSPCRASMHR
jgi:hypothetical protein